jgi:hypothetical protein
LFVPSLIECDHFNRTSATEVAATPTGQSGESSSRSPARK